MAEKRADRRKPAAKRAPFVRVVERGKIGAKMRGFERLVELRHRLDPASFLEILAPMPEIRRISPHGMRAELPAGLQVLEILGDGFFQGHRDSLGISLTRLSVTARVNLC